MLIDKHLKQLFHDLLERGSAELSVHGFSLFVNILDAKKFSLITPVYFGGNYIPKSVRSCLQKRAPFDNASFDTFLEVDEEKFEVALHFEGNLHEYAHQRFIALLEEFSWLADEWRLYLDEHDKNDLVHIPVR